MLPTDYRPLLFFRCLTSRKKRIILKRNKFHCSGGQRMTCGVEHPPAFRFSEFSIVEMHEQRDVVELWKIHRNTQKFFADTAEYRVLGGSPAAGLYKIPEARGSQEERLPSLSRTQLETSTEKKIRRSQGKRPYSNWHQACCPDPPHTSAQGGACQNEKAAESCTAKKWKISGKLSC